MFSILNKAIIKEYYRKNLFFIFAILMFAFGILRALEHITIIKLVLKSKPLLLAVFLIWGLHSAKTILFTLRLLESKNFEFLYQIRLFSFKKRIFALFYLHFSLIQLTLFYALWMIKIGFEEKRFIEIIVIVFFKVFLILVGVVFTEYRIRKPNPNKILSSSINSVFAKFRTPFHLFFVRHLFQKQPILLLLSKFFSCFMLLGVCLLFPTDEYDWRLMAIGGLFASLASMPISYELHQFNNNSLRFYRNLPFSISRLIIDSISIFLIISIPEAIILIRNLPFKLDFLLIFPLISYISSISFLFFCILFLPITDKDKFGKQVFFVGILYFLLIMFKVPIILVCTINFLIAFYVFRKHFYSSEFQIFEQ